MNGPFSRKDRNIGMEKRTVYTKEALREISFPTATVEFTDGTFPGRVTLTGWNPLIPLNDRDSGIPAARRWRGIWEKHKPPRNTKRCSKKGKAWCDKNMFNGKWYCQKLDLPNGTIGFDPVLPGVFRAPWFAGGAWGEFERTAQKTCSPWRRARCI